MKKNKFLENIFHVSSQMKLTVGDIFLQNFAELLIFFQFSILEIRVIPS